MLKLQADETRLVLTNRQRVFWPEDGFTKGDLLDYYREIAPVIMPHLVDRPQVLHRHVDGHDGKEFFQRISKGQPSWIQTVQIQTSKRQVAVAPLDDEKALDDAKPKLVGGRFTFDPEKTRAREEAMARNAFAKGPVAVVILGGAHDLGRLAECRCVRVTVKAYRD